MYGRRGKAYMNRGWRKSACRCLEALSPCRGSKQADCQHFAQLNSATESPLQRVVKMCVVKAEV